MTARLEEIIVSRVGIVLCEETITKVARRLV